MVGWLNKSKRTPIGVDVGSRVIKLVQLDVEQAHLLETGRWDLPLENKPGAHDLAAETVRALKQSREGKRFRGRDAVVCLGARQLYVQNVRVPKVDGPQFEQNIRQEVGARLPFPLAEAELRWIDAAEVRQGDSTRREVIVLAVHKPVLDQTLQIIEDAGLWPVAVDVEPLALQRVYHRQFRRELDQNTRTMLVHVGHATTCVVIAQGADVLFIKYLELGGKHLDDAVARHLKMSAADAWALRRHNGDRRTDQQDPEIARSVQEATRPVIDKLLSEVTLCIRYHSVTFRGQPLKRLVLAGGEASSALLETLMTRVDMKCELGDPLRTFDPASVPGRPQQWDLAIGLAMRGVS